MQKRIYREWRRRGTRRQQRDGRAGVVSGGYRAGTLLSALRRRRRRRRPFCCRRSPHLDLVFRRLAACVMQHRRAVFVYVNKLGRRAYAYSALSTYINDK